ncbi:MAG: ATP-binding protein, partial [Clostridia bacterium]|nr:ATP-binding protein [Clostridia bacterium]
MHPLAKQLHSFVIFRNLLSRSPLKELLKLLDTDEKDLASLNDAYAEFVCALYACDGDLGRTLEKMLCDDENI